MNLNLFFARKIQDLDYDAKNSVLTIYFQSGIIKKHCDVPQSIYNSLLNASDQNHFYQWKIDGSFCVE